MPSFLPPVSYPVSSPTAVVTADVNGDGKLDLITACPSSNSIGVLLGNGDGTFQTAKYYASGAEPEALAVADFSGNGKQDIVTTNRGDNTLSVLMGNGDGTFQTAHNFSLPGEFPPGYTGSTPIPQTPLSVAIGDMNQDGRPDLVVSANTTFVNARGTTVNNGYVDVLSGQGNGTFTAASTTLLNMTWPQPVKLADFNGDGKLDVVTASSFSTDVEVLLGNGDGTLRAPTSFVTGATNNPEYDVVDLAVADINGDGKPDIVTANAGSVSVLMGNGDGTFQAPVNTVLPPVPDPLAMFPAGGAGQSPAALVVGDLNGDGKLDLAVAANDTYTFGYYTLNSSNVNVLVGHGDGTFTTTETDSLGVPNFEFANPTNPSVSAITLGSFSGGSLPDLAAADAGFSTVDVLLNELGHSAPAASFSVSGFPSSTTAGVPGNLTATALNADGSVDTSYNGYIHFSSSDPQAILPNDIALSNGTGSFSATLETAGSQSISVTDVAYGTTGGETGITVTPAAASRLDLWSPESATAGSLFPVIVTAVDPYGNIATSFTGTIHFTSGDPMAILPADYTFTANDAGTHDFGNAFALKASGEEEINATGALTGYTTVEVNPAAASQIVVAGFPSPTTAGATDSFEVTLYDPYGNIASGYTGTVHFSSSDPLAVLPADYTFTADDAGIGVFSATLKTAGTQSITATDTTTASLTGTDAGITVNPAAASSMIVSGFPSPTTAGVAQNFTVTLKDPYGNIASGYRGTVHFTSSDGKAALPANYAFTAADAGTHTFSATLKTAGTRSISAGDTVTGSLTGTDAGITVNPAAPSKFILTAPASVHAGASFSLTLTVEDACGNVVTNYTGTVHFSSSDTRATLPANYTFKTTDNGVHTFTGLVLRTRGNQKINVTDTHNASLTLSVTVDVL